MKASKGAGTLPTRLHKQTTRLTSISKNAEVLLVHSTRGLRRIVRDGYRESEVIARAHALLNKSDTE